MPFMQRARQVAPGSFSILAFFACRQSEPLTVWLQSVVRPSAVIESRAV